MKLQTNNRLISFSLIAFALLFAGCLGGGNSVNPTVTPSPQENFAATVTPQAQTTANPNLLSSGERFVYVATNDPGLTNIAVTVLYQKNGTVAAKWALPFDGGGYGQAVDGQGNIWIADYVEDAQNVYKFSANGDLLCTNHTAPGTKKVVIDTGGNAWVTSDEGLFKFDSNCNQLLQIKNLYEATYIMADDKGSVWVSGCPGCHNVVKLDSNGNVIGTFGGSEFPCGGHMALDTEGNIWMGSEPPHSLCKVSPEGGVIAQYDGMGSGLEIAIDKNGFIWINGGPATEAGNEVTKIARDGSVVGTYVFTTAAGSPDLNTVTGLWTDWDGNIWVSVIEADSVVKINGATGAIIGEYQIKDGIWIATGDATGFMYHHFVLKDG